MKARFDFELVMMVLLLVIAVASIKLKFWNKVDFNFYRYQLINLIFNDIDKSTYSLVF